MPLFIDRLPLHTWLDYRRDPPLRRWSVSLPAIPTEVVADAPPEGALPQRWVFDTAFSGDAYAWQSHLREAGLDPRARLGGTVQARSVFDRPEVLLIRKADLWLISNLPALRGAPFRLSLSPGILVLEREVSDPESFRPLIGLRALLRAGLQVKMDLARATISVWTPGPWYQGISLFFRRTISGYPRISIRW